MKTNGKSFKKSFLKESYHFFQDTYPKIMKIFIRDIYGFSQEFNLPSTFTVRQLRVFVSAIFDLDFDAIRIMSNDSILRDNKILGKSIDDGQDVFIFNSFDEEEIASMKENIEEEEEDDDDELECDIEQILENDKLLKQMISETLMNHLEDIQLSSHGNNSIMDLININDLEDEVEMYTRLMTNKDLIPEMARLSDIVYNNMECERRCDLSLVDDIDAIERIDLFNDLDHEIGCFENSCSADFNYQGHYNPTVLPKKLDHPSEDPLPFFFSPDD